MSCSLGMFGSSGIPGSSDISTILENTFHPFVALYFSTVP